jgi:aldehyde dehydrogenase (NAD+)
MNHSSATQETHISLQEAKADIRRVFALQQENQLQIRKTNAAARKAKLQRMKEWIMNHQQDIRDALFADFRKPALETDVTEIYSTKKEIEFALQHLGNWMQPRRVSTPLSLIGSRSRIVYEPKGVSLIMAPWNYPFYLVVSPLISAITAGCSAIVKPSELTPHTSALLQRMLSELFSENEVTVFEGDYRVAEALLEMPFRHIFFTGSPAIGKLVMKAAAEHLASVTLELGGKSPAIVDETADLQDAAEKLVWGKFLNNGQTCVAPDYLLIQKQVEKPLLEAIRKTIGQYYSPKGADMATSPDYARIVNNRHHQRLRHLLQSAVEKGAQVWTGGQVSDPDRYIAPTVLTGVTDEMEIMKQEIFGPILPVVTYDKAEEAIHYVNKGEKPLALYLFSQDRQTTQQVLQQTSSGGACINDCVIHLGNPNLPFGGMNNSGLGSSHGYFGFLAFSHQKAVLHQRTGLTSLKSLYPPYTNRVKKLMAMLMKWF